MKLCVDWKVFRVLALLHTGMAFAVFGPILMTLLMEVY